MPVIDRSGYRDKERCCFYVYVQRLSSVVYVNRGLCKKWVYR